MTAANTIETSNTMARRTFMAQAAAAAALSVVRPAAVRGTQANSALALGLVGCGGRGNWIAPLFASTGRYRWAACADYFSDRVHAFGTRFDIPPERQFATLSGCKRLLDESLDAVVIETPPYFHPHQAAEAVDAGKHVFLAKPIAVDVPGCLAVAAAARRATEKKLVFLVDFQTRADSTYRELLHRVQQGAIGKLISGEAHYPWSGIVHDQPATSPDDRIRYWYQTLALSGDVIVEQDIHALDVATWFIGADPLSAYGTGGCAVRRHGNIWDHFSVIYRFPEDVVLTFTSQKGVPGVRDEIRCRVFGSDGIADTDYFGEVTIAGKHPFQGARMENLYTIGAQQNIEEFHQFIVEGNCSNLTAAPSVRSNLTSILGRTAAYRGAEVTWKEMIDSGEELQPDLSGLMS